MARSAALLVLVAFGACAAPRESPQAPVAHAPDVADAAPVLDASSSRVEDAAPSTSDDASTSVARSAPCSAGTSDDAGVVDVLIHMEPTPRRYGGAAAVFVTVPSLGLRAKWADFTAGAAETCWSDVQERTARVTCNTFETTFSLEVTASAPGDGTRTTLSAPSRTKNYDGVRNGAAFEPVSLPCGTRVVLHGLSRARHRPGDLGDSCVARCSYGARACFASCIRRFPDRNPSRTSDTSEEGLACDDTCETSATDCAAKCGP